MGDVLSLFDLSGKMVKPWAENDYECVCVDIQEHEGRVKHENIDYIQADLKRWFPDSKDYDYVFGFPPCTNLAVSGARWFDDKREDDPGFQHKAMYNVWKVRDVAESCDATWMIENPVSQISTYWRKPNYTFHPYEYDGYTDEDNKYTKKTCLWTSDDFVMPDKDGCNKSETDSRIHTANPNEERNKMRSMTPQGFANAVYEYNCENAKSKTQQSLL